MRCTFAVALLTLVIMGPAVGNRHHVQQNAMSVNSEGNTWDMKDATEQIIPHSLNAGEPLDATSAVEMDMALKSSMDGAAGASSEALAMHARNLLAMFTNLSGSDGLDGKIRSTLAQSEPLRQVLSEDMADVSRRSDSVRAAMLERAKVAMSHEDSAQLESSLLRKDSTPCACFAESWNGYPLADLDRSGGYGNCEFSCNDRCKREYKFKFDPDEARFVGADGVYQPVTASQCKGGCNCLDATQTVQQVRAAKNFNPNLDIVYTAQVFMTENECLSTCPYSCPDRNGIDWEGLCIDEYYGD